MTCDLTSRVDTYFVVLRRLNVVSSFFDRAPATPRVKRMREEFQAMSIAADRMVREKLGDRLYPLLAQRARLGDGWRASVDDDSCSKCGYSLPVVLAQRVRCDGDLVACPGCCRVFFPQASSGSGPAD